MNIEEMRERIRKVFENVKQVDIARVTGLSAATISMFMGGKNVSVDTIEKLYAAAVDYQRAIAEVEL